MRRKIKTMLSLEGRRAIFVGGSSGLGLASAQLFHRLGASVFLSGRSRERLEDAVDHFKDGARVDVAEMDVTEASSICSVFSDLDQNSIDYLVVTAGQTAHGPFAEAPVAEFRKIFDSKFWGAYEVARTAVPHLRENAAIVFVSGVLSRRPGVNCAALGAACAAVEALTRGMALELGPRIRVNCIAPGMVRTELHNRIPEDRREAVFEATGSSLPIGRIGTPEEVAEAVLLASTNGYMTGQVIDVDGGHTIRQYANR